LFHTQGIVLKKNPHREFNEIFVVYTKDSGKIEIMGRGTKKPFAKLASHLQIFDLVDIEFVLGKKFKTLTGANLIRNTGVSAARKSFFDFLDDIIGFDDVDKNIWNLILDFISQDTDSLINVFFKFRLISLAGFSPDLKNCNSCKGVLKEKDHFFSFKERGIICGNCALKNDLTVFSILSSTIKIMRIFEKQNKKLTMKLKLSKKELDDLERTLEYFKNLVLY